MAFPYLEAAKSRERRSFIELLAKEAARGPIGVTAVPTPTITSRMKRRMEIDPKVRKRANRLYTKLGDVNRA